ncbi:MAG: heme-copper oxidase subunit III [Bacteroidota bacterium]|jgi:cytochrome c oxidase subunit 3
MKTDPTQESKTVHSTLERVERMNPLKTLLLLTITGSTILFIAVSALYVATMVKNQTIDSFRMPAAFAFSTVFLLLSSFALSSSKRKFKEDRIKGLRSRLQITFLLGMIFTVCQIWGWIQMVEKGMFLQSTPGVAYLYVISGLHFVHVLGGMAYLIHIMYSLSGLKTDLAGSLLYLSDKNNLTKLDLITTYWHFVDGLWIALYFMFLLTFQF